ncbi:MAG TPA: 30S ribosomal protein S2 [Patescibacteria group bacterium]|nr:30S ribosomal protein S2 [Patescibacteria group bacterium]
MAEKKTTKKVAVKETKPKTVKSEVSLEKLLEVGAHYGHQAKRWNPKMRDFIYGTEDGVSVFDLPKTKAKLDEALAVLKEAKKNGKVVLFVGTKKQAQEKTKEVAVATNSPYIIQRFLGGTFTNFDQIKKSIKKLDQMKTDMKNGAYATYTKKEKLLLAREIEDLEKNFSGIANLNKLPDLVFIIDTHKENGAVLESKKVKIPVIGLVDSNANPDLIDYPIPMNDDAAGAVEYVLDLVKNALS